MRCGRRSTVRVVLDANVLVSAVYGGIPARAVKRARREEVWVSSAIRRELLSVSSRLAARQSLTWVARWNATFFPLLSSMRVGTVHDHVTLCRDPKDDAYLSLCRSVSADYLVTGDKDLLTVSQERLASVGLGRLAIVTPREFLARVGA